MDVSRWLAEQGLGHHADAFAANSIAGDVLRELTDADLKELGLTLGDRKRLLKAIAALNAAPTADPLERAEATTPVIPRDAERRQLTVMFVDLVGSTELAARLDPEDMSALIRTYQNAVAGEITRFEGHIAKYMGDGVLAYFGWPRAHEDEAERAVRAALGVIEAVHRLAVPDHGTPLAARVGIATGLVVVGELIGKGAAQEEAVVGETPNLAARLQDMAPPGGVVISRRTVQLVGGLFDTADLGSNQLKGFARPVQAWRVVGEGAAEGRFDARQATGLTPLVGREEELALLLRRWELAKEGEGQVVLLCGEPGIGKSRLIQTLRARLGDEPYTPLSHLCSPYHVSSTLHPVIRLLERAAGLRREDPPKQQLDKLEALLALAAEHVREVAPLLADLLAIPTEGRYPPLDVSPERKREGTLRALVAQLEGLAARQPVLALYEDAHWVDPSTLELLGLVIDRAPRLPVLVVITFRPEFTPPWTGYTHVTSLSLSRLGRRQITALVARVTGGKALPAEVVEQILAKTDGVPLFVEELTKAVLESGLLQAEGDRYVLTGPLPPLAIPATLHDSLMARLDRLASVKEVAQVAAAIGREFSHELLALVAPLDEAKLRDALDQLVAAELVFRRGTPPDAVYTFKHVLVQDAAYASLLNSRRRELHACVGLVLQERFPDSVANQPELLAHHFTEAGLAEQAIPYWCRAGERASECSANVEAIAHLSKGLALVAALPDTPRRAEAEFALQIGIGGPLIATKGHSAPEVERTYLRAQELCERLGRSSELFPVLRGLWHCYVARGELLKGRELAEPLVALAEAEPGRDPLRRALARRALGSTLFYFGRFNDASEQFERGIALDDELAAAARGDRRAHISLYADCPGVACRVYLSWSQWLLGFPDRAVPTLEAGVTLGERLAHPQSLALALCFAAIVRQRRGEFEAARRQAEAAVTVAREHSLAYFLAMGTMCRGVALARLGQHEEAIAELHAGFAGWHGTGARIFDPMWLGFTAEAHAIAGQIEAAFAALDRAAEAASSEMGYRAELHRLRGALLMETGDHAGSEACFATAVAVAHEQGATGFELRAAASLARLWRDQGKRAQARDLLAPVYDWFTEGFDTADLKDAKVLLDELR